MNNYRITPLRNTKANKNRIMANVEQQIKLAPVKRRIVWKPVVALVMLCLMLAIALPNFSVNERGANVTIDKITVPNAEYSSLIASNYVYETREIIYEQNNTLYSFDTAKQLTKELASIDDGLIFYSQVTKDWLVYKQVTDERDVVIVVNRQSGEMDSIQIDSLGEYRVYKDSLIYMKVSDQNDARFMRYDLRTGETEQLWATNSWDGLYTFIQEGNFIVFTQRFNGEFIESDLSIFDIESHKMIGHFKTDFRSIHNIQLVGDHLYMLYIDKESQKIGRYNLKSKEFTTLNIDKKVDDFATNGELFAIAVGNAGSSTVELYRLQGDKLLKTDVLDDIDERLVKPRYEGDTFIINGETVGNPLYFVDSK